MRPSFATPLKVFYAYARVDARFRTELDKHLVNLRNRGLIVDFFDGDIELGEDWDRRIRSELEQADLILPLISADFLTSAYGTGVELARAQQRHLEGTACVVPIIIRPVYVRDSIVSTFQVLPRNGIPVSNWPDQDMAYASIARELEYVVGRHKCPHPEQLRAQSIERALPRIPREPIVPFVSRRGQQNEDLASWILQELSAPSKPVLALWGAGGVGKTTLAAQVARKMMQLLAGRIAWVSADGNDGYTLATLVDEVAEQLQCPAVVMERGIGARSRQVAALVNSRPALIMFDNLETIASDQASQCLEWLTNEVRSPVLITTRERVSNVRNVPLQSMSPQESQQFLDGLLQHSQYPDALRQNADAIIKISEANPLVLQWIVSQIDLVQDPVDVFRELRHGEGDAAKRVFDRSFNLPQTGDDGRTVLLALAIFTDSASRLSLANIAGFTDDVKRVNAAIARLAALRLVSFGNTSDRVRLEGLTRELAAAKLASSGRRENFRRRFVEFFSLLCQQHDEPDSSHYDALASELGNIKAAVAIAHEIGTFEKVYSMTGVVAAPVTGFLVTRGHWRDAAQMNETALNIARATDDHRAVQFFGHNLGGILVARGQPVNAEGPLNESLRSAERNHDEYHAALTLIELATIAFMKGQTETAGALYRQSLNLSSLHGNITAMGVSLHQLGLLAQEAGDLDEARTLLVESLRIKQTQPESVSLAKTLIQIGRLAEIQGVVSEAEHAYKFALQILKRLRSESALEVQRLLDRLPSIEEPGTG